MERPDSPAGASGKPRERASEIPKSRIWTLESGTLESGISSEAKAPWEIDGRQWHTRDRIARNGQPARWDGRILERIVDQIEALACIRLRFQTRALPPPIGPNAISCESLGRTRPGSASPSFTRRPRPSGSSPCDSSFPGTRSAARSLEKQLDLVAFHESETPVLCDLPRLKITDVGPFQEITIVGHAAEDFDTPGFDAFLQKAVKAFLDMGKPVKIKKASELV